LRVGAHAFEGPPLAARALSLRVRKAAAQPGFSA
jgi:hypothetical protein